MKIDKNQNFTTFKNNFPNWEKDFNVLPRKGDGDVYKRIIFSWDEGNGQPIQENRYAATINSTNGDIYLDCRKRKIYVKNICQLILRPLHTVIKTIYHIASVVLGIEIIRCAIKKESCQELKKRLINHITDIARTPIYGLVMTIAHLAALILAPFNPSIIYKLREVTGNLEMGLNHIKGHYAFYHDFFSGNGWVLAPCFTPIANISQFHLDQEKKPTLSKEQTEKKIAKKAKRLIRNRKKGGILFNDCCRAWPKGTTYTSAAFDKISSTP